MADKEEQWEAAQEPEAEEEDVTVQIFNYLTNWGLEQLTANPVDESAANMASFLAKLEWVGAVIFIIIFARKWVA